ncbi:Sec-independent protein translocase protein TatA/E [Acididesulfobacillus acetoxydans]|uniref:Sec-independent protein translocase protein TatA n=1 Tax=Acididesulfobacillus acetoxydans TaxID=1561005 RepID=A0A8S0W3J7_9FIRM|nr:twin-arginine translocase TatA/TatE family subunit [Acididesulfobacillus acetoxydans]CAA7601758.1 Sec-independent protein translocase protein TatA/E [Acididesulfobacillus acetoxydans]CEJ09023.1 Sec-independent protein translocase protein TatA [tatA] [Acididesulfobacillus acetoxydans]
MFSTFGFLSPMEIVIVLVIALVIFGPGKLPELGKSLGQGINEFKSATSGKEEAKGDRDKA